MGRKIEIELTPQAAAFLDAVGGLPVGHQGPFGTQIQRPPDLGSVADLADVMGGCGLCDPTRK